MANSEEIILDKLLPEFQKGLDVQQLKPYLKLTCSLTDEECDNLTEKGSATDEEAVRRLTATLKRKGSHCCARIMLYALRQCVEFNKSLASSSRYSHMELISKLEWELNSTEKYTMSNGAHLSKDFVTDSKEDGAVNSDVFFFPSAVPESPYATMQFGASASSHDPSHGQLNPLSWHGHFSKQIQPSQDPNMAVVISIGPSKEPVPLVKYHFTDPNKLLESSTVLNTNLIRESKAIQKGFADFVLQVCSLLENSPGTDVEKVRLSLSYQNCDTKPPVMIFSPSSAVTKAKTIPGLLTAMSRCSSWFNYELISNMAKEFCGEEGQRLVDSYEQLLKTFLQKLVLHCPPFVNGDQRIVDGFETMEMKVNWNLQACKLQDVAIFKGTVCSLLGLNPRFLMLKSVGDQQFQLSWAIPRAAVHQVLTHASLKTEAFAKQKIESVQVADNFVGFKSGEDRLTSSPAAAHSSQSHSLKPTTETRVQKSTTPDDIDTPVLPLDDFPLQQSKDTSGEGTPGPAFPSKSKPTTISRRVTTANYHRLPKSPMSPFSVNSPRSADSSSAFVLPVVDETGAMIIAANEAKRRRSRRKISKQNVRWQGNKSSGVDQNQSPSLPSSIETQPQPTLAALPSKTSGEKKTKKVHQFRQFQSDSIIQAQQPSASHISAGSRHTISHNMNFKDHGKVSVVTLPEPLSLATKHRSPGILWRILGRANSMVPANVHVASIQATIRHSDRDLQVRKGQQLNALYRVGDCVFVETQLGKQGFVPYSCCRISRKYYGPTSKLLQLSYSKLSPQHLDLSMKTLNCNVNDKPIGMVSIKDHRALTSEELSVRYGDKLQALYCDNSWVYAVKGVHQAGVLPRSVCCLAQNAQKRLQVQDVHSPDSIVKISSPPQNQKVKQVSNHIQHIQQKTAGGDKVGKIVSVIRSYVPKSTTHAFTIRKGLRVKVLHESGQQLYVTTRSGISFWIPTCYVRIARKNSDIDAFLADSSLETSTLSSRSTMTIPRSEASSSSNKPFNVQLQSHERGLSKSSILFNSSQQYSPSMLSPTITRHFMFSHSSHHNPKTPMSQSAL